MHLQYIFPYERSSLFHMFARMYHPTILDFMTLILYVIGVKVEYELEFVVCRQLIMKIFLMNEINGKK